MSNAWYILRGQQTVAVVHEVEYHGEWMGDEFVTVTVKSPTPVTFMTGDVMSYRGEMFFIDYDPNTIKQARSESYGEAFVYENIKLYSKAHELKNIAFRDYVLNDNGQAYSQQDKFSFFAATVQDLADRIKANLDRFGGDTWTIRVIGTGYTNINITCDNISCWDALKMVYDNFGLTFIINNTNIRIGGASLYVSSEAFKYGKGKGLKEIESTADEGQSIVTKLNAYGSDKNLPRNYYANLFKKPYFIVESKEELAAATTGGSTTYLLYTSYENTAVKSSLTRPDTKCTLKYGNNTIEAFGDGQMVGEVQMLCFRLYNGDNSNNDSDFYRAVSNGSRVYITSGVDINTWPGIDIEKIDGINYYPAMLSINNLMLPGFPSQSLNTWVQNNKSQYDWLQAAVTKGFTFSEEAMSPWVQSPNAGKYGVREGAAYFDGNDNTEDIYPTIEGTGADIVSSGSDVEDNGYIPDGASLKKSFTFLVPSDILDWSEAFHSKGSEDMVVSMKTGYNSGRNFKVEAVTKATEYEGDPWKVKMERELDNSLNRYFPYSDGSDSKYCQVVARDTFVVTGIQLPKSYVDEAAIRLLKAAIEGIEEVDHPKITRVPHIDEIYMARERDAAEDGQSLYDKMKAGLLLKIQDADLGIDESTFIDQLTIKENGNNGIPTFDVVLRDEKEMTFKESIKKLISISGGTTTIKGGGMTAGQVTELTSELYPLKKDAYKTYLAIDFFNNLFTVHGTKTTTTHDEDTDEDIVTVEEVTFKPNDWPTGSEYKVTGIEAKYGIWTNYYLSALGINSANGGGGGSVSLNEPLNTINNANLGLPTSTNRTLVWDSTLNNGTGGFKWVSYLNDILTSINTGVSGTKATGSTLVWDATLNQFKWGTSAGIDWTALATETTDLTKQQIHVSHIDAALKSYAKIENGVITIGATNGTPNTITPVTSVAMTVPTGFSISGSPITKTGTLALTFASGYSLPTTEKQGQWDEAYTKRHEHSNLNVLNGITAAKVTAWDNVASIMDSPDSDDIVNKWQEVVHFLDTYTEADTLANLLSNKANKTVKIIAGNGLTGGGTLEADRTLTVVSVNNGIVVQTNGIKLNTINDYETTTDNTVRPLSAAKGKDLNDRLAVLESTIGQWFEVDGNGDIHTKDKPNNGGHRGFYSMSFLSALGLNGDNSGSAFDEDDMWIALGTTSSSKTIAATYLSNVTKNLVITYNGQTYTYNGTGDVSIPITGGGTTYTFAEGTTNGAFSVTPQGGTAQSVSIHGLKALAYKDSLTANDIPNITKSKISDFPTKWDWSNIDNKPTTFTPSAHNHDDRYYTETEVGNFKWWGRSLNNGVVSGLIENASGLKLNNTGTGYGYIDFHYNSASNYTSNIYESASGTLRINSSLYVLSSGVGIGTSSPAYSLDVNGYARATRLYLHKATNSSDNDVYLVYDNGGVHVVGGGLYADTYVSALGLNSDSSASSFDVNEMWNALTTADSTHKIDNSHLSLRTLTINGTTYSPTASTNTTITISDTYTHPTNGANTTITAANKRVLSAITVNNLGHVTSVSSKDLTANDIPELGAGKITSGTFDAARIPTISWTKIDSTTTPTSLSGYGISATDSLFASVTAGKATKLASKVKLWGNDFDGSANLTNSLKIANANGIIFYKANGTTEVQVLGYDSSGNSLVGDSGSATYLRGKSIYFNYGTGNTTGITLDSSGNVGIGGTNSSYKFYTNGNSYLNGTLYVNGVPSEGTPKFYVSGTSYFTGNVGIKTTPSSRELDVNGSIAAKRLYLKNDANDVVYIEYDTTNKGIHIVNAGLYTDTYLSALGVNSTQTSGGVSDISAGTGISISDSGVVSISQQYQILIGNGQTAYNSLSNYVTLNTAQTITVAKTFNDVLTAKKIRINTKHSNASVAGGIYYYNGSTDYLLIGQGSSNLWIGANETAGTHHLGSTYISSGEGQTYISRLIDGTRTNCLVLDDHNYTTYFGNYIPKSGASDINGHLVPNSDGSYLLGTDSKRWLGNFYGLAAKGLNIYKDGDTSVSNSFMVDGSDYLNLTAYNGFRVNGNNVLVAKNINDQADTSFSDTLASQSGCFFFYGINLKDGHWDWAGIQAGYDSDKWQAMGEDGTLIVRQNDGSGYTQWKRLVGNTTLTKTLNSTGWYRIMSTNNYGMSFLVTFHGANAGTSPVTFHISHASGYDKITQIGECAKIGYVTKVRLVKNSNSVVYLEFYYNTTTSYDISVDITPLDYMANKGFATINFTKNTATSPTVNAEVTVSTSSSVSGDYIPLTGSSSLSGTFAPSSDGGGELGASGTRWDYGYFNVTNTGTLTMGSTSVTSITNITSTDNLGWSTNQLGRSLVTLNTLKSWNGRYNSSNSNLKYCVDGEILSKAGGTLTGNLTLDRGTKTDHFFSVNNPYIDSSNNAGDCGFSVTGYQYRLWFGIGSGTTNRGIYGYKKSNGSWSNLGWMMKFDSTTTTTFYGSVSNNSDIRRKNVLENVNIDLGDIASAPLFKFTWKDIEDKTIHIGTSAQYFDAKMPEVVTKGSDGMLSLDYAGTALAGVISVARKVVTHEDEIKSLKKMHEDEMKSLKKRIGELEQEVELLKAA